MVALSLFMVKEGGGPPTVKSRVNISAGRSMDALKLHLDMYIYISIYLYLAISAYIILDP